MTETWGNRWWRTSPGATGNIGADFVAKSPPDGYTVMLADIGSLAIAPQRGDHAAVRPVKDFPRVMVAYSPHLLGCTRRFGQGCA